MTVKMARRGAMPVEGGSVEDVVARCADQPPSSASATPAFERRSVHSTVAILAEL